MKQKQTIRVTNKFTGEVMEFEYHDLESAHQVYLEIKSMFDILDKAKSKVLKYVSDQVEDRIEFEDGSTGQWVSAQRKRYLPEIVKKYLDEDQLALVTEINGKKLRDFMAQQVEDGVQEPGAWKDIEANAEVVPAKPYFVIKRG